MPGSLVELHCHTCHDAWEMTTGASQCWEHGEDWVYEQRVCSRCRHLQSKTSPFCCADDQSGCERCGGPLEAWDGRVWFEYDEEGSPGERIEGNCPRCGRRLSRIGPDGLLSGGLWD